FTFLIISGLALNWSLAAPDNAQPVPAPQLLQNAMWQAGKLQDFKLDGFLHITPARGKDRYHPVIMRTKDRQMVFEFKDDALQIRVIFLPNGSVIQRRKDADSEWVMVAGRERLAKILGSDITYEDLGLDFCRWSTVKPVGGDSILTLPAWCYESTPPTVSNYAKIRFWVSSQYLAVLRADAYGADGHVAKRVEINGVMQVGNAYTIKEMMMSTMQPGRDLAASRTYLELRDGKAGGSGL
ncbi:MAG: outer membrane lipoprotein-sorting protein, partial [Verrucomicrobiales bacterium]|nr:outer membrane lipoprotein-sorting protein [Verrucomicrobiales bacterium]